MRVLVIGATGYLGAAITENLMTRGHEVVAFVRSPRPLPRGVGQRVGELGDADSVHAAVTPDVDAVVHAATPLGDWDRERRSVSAALDGLGSPAKRFVYVSGVWVLGSSARSDGSVQVHDETSPADPIALVAGREALEEDVLTSRTTGIVVRPGVLHGRGGGIPAMVQRWAADEGRGVYVGDDERVTWATVHVDDAADLVALALERGDRGRIVHAVAETAVATPAIAAAAAESVGVVGRTRRRSRQEAATDLGVELADALALSQRVESTATQAWGWRPARPGILADLRTGSYARGRVHAEAVRT
jgi:nucleoside-diphosphate-sugar epimerase